MTVSFVGHAFVPGAGVPMSSMSRASDRININPAAPIRLATMLHTWTITKQGMGLFSTSARAMGAWMPRAGANDAWPLLFIGFPNRAADTCPSEKSHLRYLKKPPVNHALKRSRFSFVGKLFGLRNPILDSRTRCDLPQYLSYFRWGGSSQLAIRLYARPIEAILSSYADPADGGQIVRRTFIRRARCCLIRGTFSSPWAGCRAPEPPAEHPCQESHLVSSLPASFSA